jgi:flavin-dependent dehydrogenase
MSNGEKTIIGAGLAGLASASLLSNKGYSVKIIERGPSVGEWRGQDFQVVRNYGSDLGFLKSLEKYGIDVNHTHPIRTIVKYAPSGKSMEVSSNNGPLFHVVKRGHDEVSLDRQLCDSLNKKNVEFEFNRNASLAGDIISTGPILRNIAGFGYTFEGIEVDAEKILLFMDNDYAPNGYIYLAPFGNHSASVGVVSFDLNYNLKMLLDRFLEKNKIVSEIIKNYHHKEVFSGYAYSNYPETAKIGDKLFVGSAAGFVEAARGFGVKYSILSGLLAAQSIIDGSDYDLLWKNAFGNELKEHLNRHFLLSSLNNSGYEKLLTKEKIGINQYEKIPESISSFFKHIVFKKELKTWQQQYSLEKMFK